jgi:sugar (pentulose or hexulose) kinase
MNGIVVLDIGTSSLRATLYDADGRPFPSDQRLNPPVYYPDGRVEQDPAAWRTLLPSVLRSAADRAGRAHIAVAAISVTAQRSSVIPVDRTGRPLRPAIMWQDLRTASLAAALSPNNKLVYGKTGLTISPVFSAIKMLWIRRNEPEILARTHKMLGIHDYALHLLTGRYVTDHSLASRTNLLDLDGRTWDEELAALFEVDMAMLCELAPPGSIVGGLSADMARDAGLAAGTPVVSAGGDQQCAALGLGLFSADRAVANTGTGSYMIGHSARPMIDHGMRVSCTVSALPGAYTIEANLPASGTIYRWFKENLWNGDLEGTDPFEAINSEARDSGPGANGLLLIPHFNGSGTPSWDTEATGIIHGLSIATRRGDIARAVLEGIALELKGGLVLLEELCGPIGSIRVSGGMTKSPLFNQIQADVYGRPVIHYRGGEATSLGAWMAGAVATGLAADYPEAFERASADSPRDLFEPDQANRALYERLRSQALAIYTALASPQIRRLFAESN